MKKFLLTLFVGFIGIISFCNADVINKNNCAHAVGVVCSNDDLVFLRFGDATPLISGNSINVFSGYALKVNYQQYYKCYDNSGVLFYDGTSIGNGWQPLMYFKVDGYCYYFGRANDTANFYDFRSLFDGGSSSQYSSEECQSEYDLVPSSDLSSCQSSLSGCQSDYNTCQSNTSGFNDLLNQCSLNLNACNSSLSSCLSNNCPDVEYTGDLQRSNIYINNILHPGRQFINIDIPDYITWDYSVGDDDFDLYVGSGYDVDYINSVIDINSYRPSSEDFTEVFVSGLTLIVPYIVIAFFILFVWKLIKRIFK